MAADKRHERMLEEILRMPGNDTCADCHATAPRWASVNLGIFLCVGCASVHRKLGTHRSRVKSVTLDSWTREQITACRTIGNTRSNAIYNPNEGLHPPPTATGSEDRDSEIEKYIRRKYEQGAFKPGANTATSRHAPTSLNRAREANGRLVLGSVTGASYGNGVGGPSKSSRAGPHISRSNPVNPELEDVLILTPSDSTKERDLPALPAARGDALPRARPSRSPTANDQATPSKPFVQNPFGTTPSTAATTMNLINFDGAPSSTRPLQIGSGDPNQMMQQGYASFSSPGSSNTGNPFTQQMGNMSYQSQPFGFQGAANGYPNAFGANNPFNASSGMPSYQAQSPSPFHQSQPSPFAQPLQHPQMSMYQQSAQGFQAPGGMMDNMGYNGYTGMSGMNGVNGQMMGSVGFNGMSGSYGGDPNGHGGWAGGPGYANGMS
ncbi:putative GTPase activating protein for Arf-domain-containing protein [Kockovaella imperatae]|uniref:Putative GTPase activating protein for Arf-domain-containing protein n=1 Tax=Kockovaella imperatae TaxID=4999 RepID=A0A1Y1UU95_9TREE|nr:putative GTPase activating protein for Arf-domain-containing protein [Kockovaella imperatae]ORX41207.1 putative GTPase activating protein for Arf-domain-containing protein [Kockovaella imperatae]